MQRLTRAWARSVFFQIALLMLGFVFMPIWTASTHEPPAAVHFTDTASGTRAQTWSERKLERDKRALFVLLIVADQLRTQSEKNGDAQSR